MATTAQDLIQDALEMLGIYSPGETISTADSARCLFVLNSLLDELAAMNIFVYALTPTTVTIASGTSAYTIGPSNTPAVVAARPDKITMGPGAASITVGGTASPVNVVSSIEFQALSAANPTSGTPDTLWYNPTYPQGTLNVLPAPSANGTLNFTAWKRIVSFPDLSETSFTLALGVLDGVRDNLAVAAKTYFRDAQIDPVIIQRAMASRDFLRYQGQTSRAMFNRFVLSTNPQKAP